MAVWWHTHSLPFQWGWLRSADLDEYLVTGMISDALSYKITLLKHKSPTNSKSAQSCPPQLETLLRSLPEGSPQRQCFQAAGAESPERASDLRLQPAHVQELVKCMRLQWCTSDPEER